jgi:hypothetical protein
MARHLTGIACVARLICLVASCVATLSCGRSADDQPMSVTLALVNGRIWTGDPDRPWVDALATSGERIVAVGTSEAIELLSGDADVIDLRRRLVLPGFIDTHTHLLDLGDPADNLNLSTARSRRQFVARIRAATADRPDGVWIRGREWDHRLWDDTLPHRDWIDRVTPRHPVWLLQREGQVGLANSLALEQAGIAAGMPGAQMSGESVTGLLTGSALERLEAALPPDHPSARDSALDRALSEAAVRGVTSVHHFGDWDDLDVFTRARTEGRLTLRIYAVVPLESWLRLDRAVGVRAFGGADGRGDDWLRVGGVHAELDGTLVARSAAFTEPYADAAVESGRLDVDVATLRSLVIDADGSDLQVMLRAAGDRANRVALDLHEQLVASRGPRDRRFRVELAQHLRPTDIARFASGGVLASMRPFATVHDGRWVDRQIGTERARTSFPFRALLDAGARVTFGSGWLDRATPMDGIYAAVTRRTLDGLHPRGWVPEQRITVEEALRAYTGSAAYAAFEEGSKGRLTVGRLADLIVVDRDLLSVPANDIPTVRVVMTVVGGSIVFDRLRVAES